MNVVYDGGGPNVIIDDGYFDPDGGWTGGQRWVTRAEAGLPPVAGSAPAPTTIAQAAPLTVRAYPPGSLQLVAGADGMYSAVNPRTGQLEPVYLDNDTSQMYFQSDGGIPAGAQPAGVPTYHSSGGDALSNILDTAATLAAGTAGFGAGGVSGASAATGNGVTPQTVAADAAGLGAGAGLAQILPALGLSTAAPVMPPAVLDTGAMMPPAIAPETVAPAGLTNLPLAPAPIPTSDATLSAILSGSGSATPAISDAQLQAILDSASVPTAANGIQVASAGELPAITIPPSATAPAVDLTTAGNAANGLSLSATGANGITPGIVSATGDGLGSGITSTLAGNVAPGSLGALSNDALFASGALSPAALAALTAPAAAIPAAASAAPAAAAAVPAAAAPAVTGSTVPAAATAAAGATAAGAAANDVLNQAPDPAPAPPPSSPQDIQLGQGDTVTTGGGYTVDPVTGNVLGSAAGTAAGNAAGSSIGGTKLGDILSGNVDPSSLISGLTVSDLSKLLGTVGSTALGVAGANKQADTLKALSDQYMALGAPSRARYEASFQPGFDVNSIPGFTNALDTTTQSVLRGLSTQGNPWGNPGGLTQAMNYVAGNLALPTLQNYRNQNAATGGYGAFNSAAPSTATNAVGAQGGVYNALGSGLADLTNPQPSLQDILSQLRRPAGGLV